MNRANRPRLSRISGSSYATKLLGRAGDGSTLTLDFTTGVLDPRLTFSRDGGGTYIGNDGRVYGMDFATSSSLAIGTGSKSVTLTATAGVDRRYLVGQTVWISNGANNMRGPVTAYNASTQVLTIDATGTSGSGSFTSWTVGNASARFDYDPTTLAPKGLLIEGSASNVCRRSEDFADVSWTVDNSGATNPVVSTVSQTAPNGASTVNRVTLNKTGGTFSRLYQAITGTAGQTYTLSVWMKANTANGGAATQNVGLRIGGSTGVNCVVTTTWQRFTHPAFAITGTDANFQLLLWDNIPANDETADVLVWGAQVETGSASSYIPTGASTATRNADNCSIVSPNFAPWYGSPTGWTIVADMTPQSRAAGSFPGMLALRSAADSGLRIYYYNDGTYNTAFRFATASTGVEVYGPNGVTYGVPRKFGASVTSGTQFASSAGVQIGSTQTLAVPMDQTLLAIGSDGVSPTPAVNCRMHFRSIKYWPYAMTLAELNARTT